MTDDQWTSASKDLLIAEIHRLQGERNDLARRAAPEAAEPVAPVAKIVMKDGEIVKAATYMPGLPDGEHELYVSAGQVGRDAVDARSLVEEFEYAVLGFSKLGTDAARERLKRASNALVAALSTTAGRAE